MAQLFMFNLDIDVTFFYQNNPAFCLKEKGKTLNDEDQERAFWRALVDKNAEEDGYEDGSNESFPKNLTL